MKSSSPTDSTTPSSPLKDRNSTCDSGDLAVTAVSNRVSLGVDVEQAKRQMNSAELIRTCAAANERPVFAALPQEHRERAFYWWTRKEALLKALGSGHSLLRSSLDVSILAEESSVAEVRSPELCQHLSVQTSISPQVTSDHWRCPALCARLKLAMPHSWP